MANPMRLSTGSEMAYFRRYSRKRVFARFYSHRIYLENGFRSEDCQATTNVPNILYNKPTLRKHIWVDLVWSQMACIARHRVGIMAFLPFSLYFWNKKWQYEINAVENIYGAEFDGESNAPIHRFWNGVFQEIQLQTCIYKVSVASYISQERLPIGRWSSDNKCAWHIVQQACIEKTYMSRPCLVTNGVYSKA